MQDHRLDYLLDRYLAKAATPEELIEFDALLKEEEQQTNVTDTVAERMRLEPAININYTDKWDRMLENILSVDKPVAPHASSRIIQIYRRGAAAAAAIFLALISTWLWTKKDQAKNIAETVISTDHEPKSLTLPDGTHVWLNAGSFLRYPATFAKDNRTIRLSGEAFFDVQHAGQIPFRIQSDKITTTVLGTSFDITAYDQKQTIISVATGKVKVETTTKTLAILEKGARLRIASDTTAETSNFNAQQIAAWRTGNLTYKNETLEDIVADLRRNFPDSIRITNPGLKKVMINISVSKATGLNNALDMITRTTDSRLTYKNGIYSID